VETKTGKLWCISAYAANPVYLSDCGLLDFEEIDLGREVRAETAAEAHAEFMDWIEHGDVEIVGELFIESIKEMP
jgi:hypothetical protein